MKATYRANFPSNFENPFSTPSDVICRKVFFVGFFSSFKHHYILSRKFYIIGNKVWGGVHEPQRRKRNFLCRKHCKKLKLIVRCTRPPVLVYIMGSHPQPSDVITTPVTQCSSRYRLESQQQGSAVNQSHIQQIFQKSPESKKVGLMLLHKFKIIF